MELIISKYETDLIFETDDVQWHKENHGVDGEDREEIIFDSIEGTVKLMDDETVLLSQSYETCNLDMKAVVQNELNNQIRWFGTSLIGEFLLHHHGGIN